MTDHTMKIIYTIKKANKPWNIALAEHLSKETGNSVDTYLSESIMYDVIKDAFMDYIKTCDNIPHLIYSLLYQCKNRGIFSMSEHLAFALMLEQVTKDGKYINGFKPQ